MTPHTRSRRAPRGARVVAAMCLCALGGWAALPLPPAPLAEPPAAVIEPLPQPPLPMDGFARALWTQPPREPEPPPAPAPAPPPPPVRWELIAVHPSAEGDAAVLLHQDTGAVKRLRVGEEHAGARLMSAQGRSASLRLADGRDVTLTLPRRSEPAR